MAQILITQHETSFQLLTVRWDLYEYPANNIGSTFILIDNIFLCSTP